MSVAAFDDAEDVEGCGTGSADCIAGTFVKNMVMGRCVRSFFISFRIFLLGDILSANLFLIMIDLFREESYWEISDSRCLQGCISGLSMV